MLAWCCAVPAWCRWCAHTQVHSNGVAEHVLLVSLASPWSQVSMARHRCFSLADRLCALYHASRYPSCGVCGALQGSALALRAHGVINASGAYLTCYVRVCVVQWLDVHVRFVLV